MHLNGVDVAVAPGNYHIRNYNGVILARRRPLRKREARNSGLVESRGPLRNTPLHMPAHLQTPHEQSAHPRRIAVALGGGLLLVAGALTNGPGEGAPLRRAGTSSTTPPTVLAEEIVASTTTVPPVPPTTSGTVTVPTPPPVTGQTPEATTPPTILPPLIITSPTPPRTITTEPPATTTTVPIDAAPPPGDL